MIRFIDVLISTITLLILAIPGYIMKKIKIVDKKTEQGFSDFVLYVGQAFLVFMCFLNSTYTKEVGTNMLITAGLTIVPYIVVVLVISRFSFNDFLKNEIIRYGGIFGNVGFMGLPFLQMLFSGHSEWNMILIYAGVCVVIFNLLNWTLGVYVISKDKKQVSLKKILLNPVIIGAVLGFLVFFIVRKPITEIGEPNSVLNQIITKLSSSFNYLSGIVTPLSMTVIGMKLADMNLKEIFLDKYSYLVCFIKLIIFPIVAILVVSFLNVSVAIKYTIFLTAAMPCATSTTLFAVKFNKVADFASSTVLLSTLLSAVTIPLTFLIFSEIFGVVI